METIATLYKNIAMADGPKLPAGASEDKNHKIQVFTATSHEQKRYPDEGFLNPRMNKPYAGNKKILIFTAN